MENIPYIRKIGMEMDITQALISSRLGWSQQQYCDFKEDAGYMFISFITRNLSERHRAILSFSGLFWKWWRNQWFARDTEFYELERLQTEHYIFLHTDDLETDQKLLASFWSHSEAIFRDGRFAVQQYERQREVLA
jgi:hypothetical protein